MGGITVRELAQDCNELIKQGYGDKIVQISTDDEGNGYHTLYYSFTVDDQTLNDVAESGMLHDWELKPEDIVLLG